MLTEDQYNDEKTDAGEIGAGHTTTAVYEIVLNEEPKLDEIEPWVDVQISFKDPETDESKVIDASFDNSSVLSNNNEDIIFISGVVEFGLILRNSEYKADANLDGIISRLDKLNCVKDDVYKKEFLELVKKYKNYIK